MPECRNCGAFLTEAFVRVFEPCGAQNARACPHCEDKVLENGSYREARGHAGRANEGGRAQ